MVPTLPSPRLAWPCVLLAVVLLGAALPGQAQVTTFDAIAITPGLPSEIYYTARGKGNVGSSRRFPFPSPLFPGAIVIDDNDRYVASYLLFEPRTLYLHLETITRETNPSLDLFQHYTLSLYFTVDSRTPYSLEGSMAMSQLSGVGEVSYSLSLEGNTPLFISQQVEDVAADEGYLLSLDGSSGGDHINTVTGSPRGTLLPGVQYHLDFAFRQEIDQTTPEVLDSYGILTISFIPEPSTILLLTLGALGIFRRSRQLTTFPY